MDELELPAGLACFWGPLAVYQEVAEIGKFTPGSVVRCL